MKKNHDFLSIISYINGLKNKRLSIQEKINIYKHNGEFLKTKDLLNEIDGIDKKINDIKELFYRPLLDRIDKIKEDEFEKYITNNMSNLIKKSNDLNIKYKELNIKKQDFKKTIEASGNNEIYDIKCNSAKQDFDACIIMLSIIKDKIKKTNIMYDKLSVLNIYKFKNNIKNSVLSFNSTKELKDEIRNLKQSLNKNNKFKKDFYNSCYEYLKIEDEYVNINSKIDKNNKDEILNFYKKINEFYDLCDKYFDVLNHASLFINDDNIDIKFDNFINSDIRSNYLIYKIDENFINENINKLELNSNKFLKTFKSKFEIMDIKNKIVNYLKEVFMDLLFESIDKIIDFSNNSINIDKKIVYNKENIDFIYINKCISDLKQEVKELKKEYDIKNSKYDEFEEVYTPKLTELEKNKIIAFDKIISVCKKYSNILVTYNKKKVIEEYLKLERDNIILEIENNESSDKVGNELQISFMKFKMSNKDLISSSIDESLKML